MSAPTAIRTLRVDSTPRPRPAKVGRLAVSEIALIVAALLGWAFLYALVLSGLQHGHDQAQLYSQLRSELAEGTAPVGAPIAEGSPVALVDIPAIGLSHEVVVEGSTSSDLRRGVGHLSGSALPGQAGASVLMGKSLTFGAPFKDLGGVPVGTVISVVTQQGTFAFKVSGLRHAGDVVAPLAAGASRLTLVTAAGGGGLSRASTVYVDADLQGKAVPAGSLGAVDQRGVPMAADNGVLTFALLVLTLQVLIVAVGWLIWASRRWSPVAAWTTGLPVLLAALWMLSSTASRLLPNLI